jgi:hypothetical protein
MLVSFLGVLLITILVFGGVATIAWLTLSP